MSGNRYTDGRQDGAALKPLSGLQKQKLVLLAKQAWGERRPETRDQRPQTEDGRPKTTDQRPQTEDCPFDVPGEAKVSDFDGWRREQCMQVVERPGLTACCNEDYLPLTAHFLRLLGRTEEAEAALTRAEMEPRVYLMGQFNRAAQEAMGYIDDPVRYAEGFLRKACGCGIDDAPDKALWRAIYLLRNKVRCERKKEGSVA
jgi:hypothetical protein